MRLNHIFTSLCPAGVCRWETAQGRDQCGQLRLQQEDPPHHVAPTREHHRRSRHQQPLHLPRQGELRGSLPCGPWAHRTCEGLQGEARVWRRRERWTPRLHPSAPLPVSCRRWSWFFAARLRKCRIEYPATEWISGSGKNWFDPDVEKDSLQPRMDFHSSNWPIILFISPCGHLRKGILCIYTTRGLRHE